MHLSGIAYHDETTGFLFHPKYGTWIEPLGCVYLEEVMEVSPAEIAEPIYIHPSPQSSLDMARSMREHILGQNPPTSSAALSDREILHLRQLLASGTVAARDWELVRQSCTLGRQHAWSRLHLDYHYTNTTQILRQAVACYIGNVS
jgi:hypothetical protein